MPTSLNDILDRLLDGQNLPERDASELLTALAASDMAPAMAGALLGALRAKGVTAAELRGLAAGMRALARRPRLPAGLQAVDIVGTGGDRSGSLNLSTGAALLAAACGLAVVKHGNRAVSSRAGSADVLESLGVEIALDEQRAGDCLAATGFTFLFAPHYHPAMRSIAPVRAALGVRTVFNILGPLSNPAEPAFQVVGAFDLPTAELMAQALSGMPLERALVIHGAAGWDEPTPVGPVELFDVRAGAVRRERRIRRLRSGLVRADRSGRWRCRTQRAGAAAYAGGRGTRSAARCLVTGRSARARGERRGGGAAAGNRTRSAGD